MCYWDCRDKHSLLQAGEWNSVLPVWGEKSQFLHYDGLYTDRIPGKRDSNKIYNIP